MAIPKWKALALLSSDALSSTAYATEEVLIPLAAFAAAAVSWSMPVAFGIAGLLLILTLSYRQIIQAYPMGGGSYVIAKENLGPMPGLVAAAALLIDYVLTVAVSVAAGVANIVSAFPELLPYNKFICAVCILLLMVLNLRGIKQSSVLLALPTYFFVLSFGLLIGTGVWKLMTDQVVATAPILHEVYPEIPIFLLLRSFSSGCAALTGIEAIANNVQSFRYPEARNARVTLARMAVILSAFFLGLTLLAHTYGIMPREDHETVISLMGRAVFGEGSALYFVVQASVFMILMLAANTSYSGFPRLASMLARDRYLPRQLASVGDRLVFSNGIFGLCAGAIALIFLFDADTHHLIPLYAVGVFLSFGLSQLGMIKFHLRERKKRRIKSLLINTLGAGITFGVFAVIAVTKFMNGAWMVFLVLPLLVFTFHRIHTHYISVGKELSLVGQTPPGRLTPLKHTVIIPVSGIHRGVLDAVRYGISICDDVRACYVEIDAETTARVQAEWSRWAHEVPFVVLKSPYRSVIKPLIEYVEDIEQVTHDDLVTIIIPEFVTAKWWHQILHNQTALMIRAALMFRKNKVVTSVRYHLKST